MSSWGIRSVPEGENRESFKEITFGMETEDGSLKPGHHEINCGTCPRACSLLVIVDDERKILSVTGNRCRRGVSYVRGLQEGSEGIFHASVKVRGGMEEKCMKLLFQGIELMVIKWTLKNKLYKDESIMISFCLSLSFRRSRDKKVSFKEPFSLLVQW